MDDSACFAKGFSYLLHGIFFDLRASAANHFDTRSTSPDLTACRQDTTFGVVLVAPAGATLTAGTGGDLLRASRCRDAESAMNFFMVSFRCVLLASAATRRRLRETIYHEGKARRCVVHKMPESPRPWKRNGHEEACQIPHAGLPTAAKVDVSISI